MTSDTIILFIAVGLAIGGVIYLMVKGLPTKTTSLNTAWYAEQWRGIEAQHGDGSAGQQLAIVNADKLLDKAMGEKRFKGQTMGERLKFQPQAFKDMNAVWSAHKLRNRIAHEHHLQLSLTETQRALQSFKAALRQLGAL